MRVFWIILTLLVALIALLFGGSYLAQKDGIPKEALNSPSPTLSTTSQPTSNPTGDPAVSPVGSSNTQGNIQVTSPLPNSHVKLPIIITGKARVFENQFTYRVLDVNKNKLVEGSAYANAPDVGQFGVFSIKIDSLPKTSSNAITLEIFDYSPKDGAEIDKVSIPVVLEP
jgi:hypothetical protein